MLPGQQKKIPKNGNLKSNVKKPSKITIVGKDGCVENQISKWVKNVTELRLGE